MGQVLPLRLVFSLVVVKNKIKLFVYLYFHFIDLIVVGQVLPLRLVFSLVVFFGKN